MYEDKESDVRGKGRTAEDFWKFMNKILVSGKLCFIYHMKNVCNGKLHSSSECRSIKRILLVINEGSIVVEQ